MRKPAKTPKHAGSTTNASDAVDDVRLPAKPSADQVVDHAVEETFPASDPVAVDSAKKAAKAEPAENNPQPKRRSPPDWLLNPPR